MRSAAFFPLIVLVMLAGCDRSAMRIPGASFDFEQPSTGFVASKTIAASIEVAVPSDMRPAHTGERVAGTDWTACRQDTMSRESPQSYVQGAVSRELASSHLFIAQGTPHLVLAPEIDAFCAQVVGFVVQRVAGIVSIKFTLLKDGNKIWEGKYEHVVTDADKEYTGGQIVTIEQGMRSAMQDSFRLVLRDLLNDLARNNLDITGAGGAAH